MPTNMEVINKIPNYKLGTKFKDWYGQIWELVSYNEPMLWNKKTGYGGFDGGKKLIIIP